RIFHHAIVAVRLVAIGDEDVAIGGNRDGTRRGEMLLVASRNTRFAERHEHFPIRTEFENLMTGFRAAFCRQSHGLRTRSVRHPDIALLVDMQSVWPDEHRGPEFLAPTALRVELEQPIDVLELVVGRQAVDPETAGS